RAQPRAEGRVRRRCRPDRGGRGSGSAARAEGRLRRGRARRLACRAWSVKAPARCVERAFCGPIDPCAAELERCIVQIRTWVPARPRCERSPPRDAASSRQENGRRPGGGRRPCPPRLLLPPWWPPGLYIVLRYVARRGRRRTATGSSRRL